MVDVGVAEVAADDFAHPVGVGGIPGFIEAVETLELLDLFFG